MTLKLTRFLTDAMNKQVKIAHFTSKVKVGKPDKLVSSVRNKIVDQFGELFLNDANYVIMTKVDANAPDFDKTKKKFSELIANVLNTEIAKNEVKVLALEESAASQDELEDTGSEDAGDEAEYTPAASSDVALFVKVTTK